MQRPQRNQKRNVNSIVSSSCFLWDTHRVTHIKVQCKSCRW